MKRRRIKKILLFAILILLNIWIWGSLILDWYAESAMENYPQREPESTPVNYKSA